MSVRVALSLGLAVLVSSTGARAEPHSKVSWGAALFGGTRQAQHEALNRVLAASGYASLDSTFHVIGVEGRVGTGGFRLPVALELELGSRDSEGEGGRVEVSEYAVGIGAGWELRAAERFTIVPQLGLTMIQIDAEADARQSPLFRVSDTAEVRKQVGALDLGVAIETQLLPEGPFWMARIGYRLELYQGEWGTDAFKVGDSPELDVSGAFVLLGLGFGQSS